MKLNDLKPFTSFLAKSKRFIVSEVIECKLLQLSPSGLFAKLDQYQNGCRIFWVDTKDWDAEWEIVEILERKEDR